MQMPLTNPLAVSQAGLLLDTVAGQARSLIDLAQKYARSVDARADAHALAGPSSTGRSSALSTDEWDELFNAVKGRLRITVSLSLAAAAGPVASSSVGPMLGASVLECVDALELLHALLQLERGHLPPP